MIILIGPLSGAVTRLGSQAISVIITYRFKDTINYISADSCWQTNITGSNIVALTVVTMETSSPFLRNRGFPKGLFF